MIRVALVGARGFVGFELIQLIDKHPQAQLVAAYSREYVGKKISKIVKGFSDTKLLYSADELQGLAELNLDVVFLALPNNIAAKYKHQWQQMSHDTCIIDLSSDFRFDDEWTYGQPETCAKKIKGQNLIANPGCYATASQLGLLPISNNIDGVPHIFGVSGYSGAGSKPSDKNNPKKLKDNLMAYKLVDHIHENEVSRVLGQQVYFMPHVGEFFRGIHLTISIQLKKSQTVSEIINTYNKAYKNHELIEVTNIVPEVRDIQNTHKVNIGGFSLKDKHLVLCVTIDNLLKGAATQAIQNMNLSLGFDMDFGF